MLFDVKDYPHAVRSPRRAEGPSGVGGWLKFLIVILCVFYPLASLGAIGILFSVLFPAIEQAGIGPVIKNVPLLVPYMIVEIVLLVLAISAGSGLQRIKPKAVQKAKQFFIINLCFQVLFTLILMGQLSEVGSGACVLVKPVIGFLIWYLYLTKSVRVRNTYPDIDD